MTTTSLSPASIILIVILVIIIALISRPRRPPTVFVLQPPSLPDEGAGCMTTMIIGCVIILSVILLASVT